MPNPAVFGCPSVELHRVDPRWERVRKDRVAHDFTLRDLHDVDMWANRHVLYRADGRDSWQLPSRTIVNRAGDCEDIALLKRAALIAAGHADDDILFLIVSDLITRQDHALLIVEGHVLDSFNSLTLPVAQVHDYHPIMGWTGARCWLFGKAV